MGGFLLIRKDKKENPSVSTKSAVDFFRHQHRNSQLEIIEGDAFSLLLASKETTRKIDIYRGNEGDFCVSVGTFFYKGEMGIKALQMLCNDFEGKALSADEFIGTYFIFIRKEGRLFCFGDAIGMYKVYRGRNETIWSSSFLSVVAGCQPNLTLNDQAVYEYIFQGATYYLDTIFNEITQLPTERLFEIQTDIRNMGNLYNFSETETNKDDEIIIHERLKHIFEILVRHYKAKMDSALSGGYDSRLILALLRHQKDMPALHVYGDPESKDVTVARTIAAGEGFHLNVKDKSQQGKIYPDDFQNVLEENYLAFDGLPPDGIFDNGADLATRRERAVGGRLTLNGGGGEIFRNFFYLADRKFTPLNITHSFYAQFDPKNCTSLFRENQYLRTMAGKIRDVLKMGSGRMPRSIVELVYPLFRCRYWTARNHMINLRIGDSITPFIDPVLVNAAARIPLSKKNCGIFEAELIKYFDSKLSSYPSDYGHSFHTFPTWRHRIKDFLARSKWPQIRRYSYRIKINFRPLVEKPFWMDTEYLQAAGIEGFNHMKPYFHVHEIKDLCHLNRLASVEYLMAQLKYVGPGISQNSSCVNG